MFSIHTVLKREGNSDICNNIMNIKNITPHEITQTNIIYSMIPLIYKVLGDRK